MHLDAQSIVLCKAVFPVCYLSTNASRVSITYLLLLSLFYTTAHVWVPCPLILTDLEMIKKWLLFTMIKLYYKTHAYIY